MTGKLLSLLLALGVIGNVTVVRAENIDWTGAAGDGDWMNAANWSANRLPVVGDRADIENATPLTWPILDGATASCDEVRIAYVASSIGELTVTGGATLNVGGELRLGRKASDPLPTGHLYISGADTKVLVSDRIECGRYGNGIIDMTGGYLHSDAELRLAHRDGSSGTVYLRGGTIDLAGDPGITVTAGGEASSGLIDISGDGMLILAGDQVALAETFVSDGVIIAYGGESIVSVAYDPSADVTTIVAVSPERATAPHPAEGETDVAWDAVLNWKPGRSASRHDVYLGTDRDEVANATTTVDPAGVYRGRQDPNAYAIGRFELGRTYYWRVDEVTAAPGNMVIPGDIWQFTVEPVARPLAGANIIATASSTSSDEEGPVNTVNGSGLDANDLHSTEVTEMWLSDAGAEGPVWIQYEFNKLYAIHQMLVWNHNSGLEAGIGVGVKDAIIEYSTDGVQWMTLGTMHEIARAPGAPGYAHNTVVDFNGVAAKYVKITVESNWGDILSQFGLSEVRFLYLPLSARKPGPVNGATGVDLDAALTWRAGREAVLHEVYLDTDRTAVADGTARIDTVSENRYALEPLDVQLGQTYYWRIDEVNEAEIPGSWEGDVWSFSTLDYLTVDDFESYSNDSPNRVFQTWIDGLGYSEDEFLPTGHPGNGSGAAVGHDIWSAGSPHFGGTIIETTIVQSGAGSMPLYYDNTAAPYYSEAERTWTTPQDWMSNGIHSLGFWYYGAGSVARVDYDDASGVYTVTGGGDDNIGGGNLLEDFTFVCLTLTGDGTITARVESITQATDTGKAGVMIRNSLDADSAFISATCNPTGGVFQSYRVAAGEESVNTRVDYPLPYWVRVQRVANNFKTFHSIDGQTWAQFGDTLNIPMDGEVYVGLVASTSQGRNAPSVAVLSDVGATGGVSGATFTNFVDVTDDTLNVTERLYVKITDAGNRIAEVEITAAGTADNQWNEGLADLTALTGQVDLSRVKALAIGVGDAAVGSSGLIYVDDVRLYPAPPEQQGD